MLSHAKEMLSRTGVGAPVSTSHSGKGGAGHARLPTRREKLASALVSAVRGRVDGGVWTGSAAETGNYCSLPKFRDVSVALSWLSRIVGSIVGSILPILPNSAAYTRRFFILAKQSSQYHRPLGGFLNPIHGKWNHSRLQSAPSHPTISPNETWLQ